MQRQLPTFQNTNIADRKSFRIWPLSSPLSLMVSLSNHEPRTHGTHPPRIICNKKGPENRALSILTISQMLIVISGFTM
ncbi:hypothetical protein SAMN05443582_102737 [Phyllobacterium sp. OV277]|nr:hypothetical protein SAMN05443582_102737 [Phyllobacterium sp. OV277]